MNSKSSAFDSAQGIGGATGLERPLAVGGLLARNRVFLAPLSGISDVPFRRLALRFGAGLTFSEMIASGELLKRRDESLLRAMADGGRIHAVQLAGRDPLAMEEAARQLAAEGADLIDINFGCPAKKVVGGQCGSALMREPELALRLVEATVAGAGNVPVSMKMRLGWDRQSENASDLGRAAIQAGVAMITVHGRTRAQFYEGRADWDAIKALRRVFSGPFVGNGDIDGPDSAVRCFAKAEVDAVMIGRACQGRPWLPGLVAGSVTEQELAGIPFGELVEEHYEAMLTHYGPHRGMRHARKHLGWYFDRCPPGAIAPEQRQAVLSGSDCRDVVRKLRSLLRGMTVLDAEAAGSCTTMQARAA